jgi:pectate lyase
MSHTSSMRAAALVSLVSKAALFAALSACGDSESQAPGDITGVSGAPSGGTSSSGGAGGDDGQGGSSGGELGQGGAGAGTNEGNPDPVGISGASGIVPANGGSSNGGPVAGAGGALAAGGTGNVPPGCDVIPTPSPLVGWASVAGLGVETTTGGGDAAPTIVTTLAELQQAVAGDTPAVILVRGELEPGDIEIGSNKTIAGTCGATVRGHLEIREAENVIVQNLTIIGYSEGDCSLDPGFDPAEGCSSGDDAVSIQRNAHHIWFDHCAVRDGSDGNLDVTNGADFVTVSWTKFSYTPRTDDVGSDATGAAGHRYSNLVGGTDEPDDFDDANALNVTWHHNWWADNVVERQPRIRFGQNHLFNNLYDSLTTNYCVRAGIQARVLLEGNVFDGVDDPHEFNNAADELTANITADDSNIYLATTSDRATGGGGPAFLTAPYDYVLDDAAGVPEAVRLGAGPR